ncbi:MAG TPA: aldehyde ferredoxin oxidoreductase family protein [Dehalococcoidia bacterium]
MAGGYIGRFLFVDLTQGKISDELAVDDLYQNFFGGYGIGARVLFSRQKAKVDPLGPEAMLGFVAGLLTGTPALFGSRYVVVGKSPLTGTWGDANSGGDFGPYLKFSGYDAVFFSGISPSPVYLSIDNCKASLNPADDMWGKDTWETESILQAKYGKEARVTCIGPAGESQSLISCIINDRGRAAGRSGLGAVMGSKKLKAIVVKGEVPVPIAHELELKEARTTHIGQLGGAIEAFRKFGTCSGLSVLVQAGDTPVKNWKGTALDFTAAPLISDQKVIDLQERRYGCWHCPAACGGHMKAGTGQYTYPASVHKPEYETLAAFGSMCLNDNLESIVKANEICNSYGLDTISTGVTIAFAIECYENGLISNKDTGGIELKWGNHKAIVDMTEKLAKRHGFGEVLADGVKRAAEKIGKGAEDLAIHIHGQEVPMHDPKRYLNYTTTYLDSTPGRHTTGNYSTKPASGFEFPAYDRKSQAGRGEANKMGNDLMNAISCAGLCQFGYGFMSAAALTDFVNLITGWNCTMDDLLQVGDRVACIRQAFNSREGISISDFKVPGRVSGNPPPEAGPTAGRSADVATLLKDYCVARGWDTTTGKPTKDKLLALGLDDVAKALWD